jgi:hypothetical protein
MNSWFDYQSQAWFVQGELSILGYKKITAPFLLDTGSTSVVIAPIDSRRLGINHSTLATPTRMTGIGGITDAYPMSAELAFVGRGRIYIYRLNVLIVSPTQDNGQVPSLLGRAILWRWNISVCHDRSFAQIDPSSWDDMI